MTSTRSAPPPFRAANPKKKVEAPKNIAQLTVKYGGTNVINDDLLTTEETETCPTIEWEKAGTQKLYTLVMVDPDAPRPNRPTAKWWRHWMMIDIMGVDLQSGISTGKTPTPYKGPDPPSDSDPHRYQFLLYEQNGPAQDTLQGLPGAPTPREKWNLDHFLVDNKLTDRLVAQIQFKAKAD